MEPGSTSPQESVPVVSKVEQKIQETTKDFSEPELQDFLRNLDEDTRREIRECFFQNKNRATYIQKLLASVEMEESKEDFKQMYGR